MIASLFELGQKNVEGQSRKGFAIWDTASLEYNVTMYTERGSAVLRLNESELQVGKCSNAVFILPVRPLEAQTLLHCEVSPEAAAVLLELHSKRRMASGILLFESERKIARIITRMEDLLPGVAYTTHTDELFVERSAEKDSVTLRISQNGKLHHFCDNSSSPGLQTPTMAVREKYDLSTPVHHRTAGAAETSLVRRVKGVRGRMAVPVRETPAVQMSAIASPERVCDESEAETAPQAPVLAGPTFVSAPSAPVPSLSAVDPSGAAAPPPPPPPPPTSSTGGNARTPTKKRLTRLHWKPAFDRQSSFFSTMTEQSPVKRGDLELLESLFSAASPVARKGKSAKPVDSGMSRLVAFKTNQRAGIVLSKFRSFSLPELRRAVCQGELDLEQLRALRSLYPLSTQEMQLLSQYRGSIQDLQSCEQFYLEMMKIPRIEARLECLVFEKSVRGTIADLKRSFAIVLSACAELRDSPRLAELLKQVAKIARHMTRDERFTFSLSSLLQMADVKSKKDKSASLLSYFVSVCDSSLLAFAAELPSLSYVARISVASLEEEHKDVAHQLAELGRELELSSDSEFVRSFRGKHQEIAAQIAAQQEDLDECRQVLRETILYFGEDPASTDAFAFFSLFVKFDQALKKTVAAAAKPKLAPAKKRSENAGAVNAK